MTEFSAPSRPAWLGSLVFAGLTAGFVVAAAGVMFSTFMFYDDEGYVLISLGNFAEHGHLYRDVYTQYGPFPFVLYYFLQELGMPLTHTTGRLITLGAWSATAMGCAALVSYATHHFATRLAALGGVFLYLWVMASEPTHPGGLIVVLIALLAALGYHWIASERVARWALGVGAVTAMLLLTKINIGVFVAFSACAWWLLHHRNDTIRRWAPAIVIAGGVVLPLGLMRPLLGTAWVQSYALVFAGAIASTTMAGRPDKIRVGWRTLGLGVIAAAVVAAVVIGIVLIRGTQPRDLLEGLLLGPLRQPTHFSLPFVWAPGIRVIAAVSLMLCILALVWRRRDAHRADIVIAVARLVAAGALAGALALFPRIDPAYSVFGVALPFVWLFVWPLAEGSSNPNSARTWVALLLLGQCLHAFPVPGSQLAWGSVLLIPLAAIGAVDSATWLSRQTSGAWLARRPIFLGVHVVVFGLVGWMTWRLAQVAHRYSNGQFIAQPGAERVRLPDASAVLVRTLTANASAHADMLFSLPGMFSFNLWTGVPTPTRANVTHWFSLLDAGRQQAIVDALAAAPRACVVIYRDHVEFLAKRRLAPAGPLYDYITRNFEPAFAVDRFEFCVRRGRKIRPFLIGELLERSPTADPSAVESTLLRLSLPDALAGRVASVEVTPRNPADGMLRLSADNARVEVTPLTSQGEPAGPPHRASWPLKLSGPVALSIFYQGEKLPSPAMNATLVLRDVTGREVALAQLQL